MGEVEKGRRRGKKEVEEEYVSFVRQKERGRGWRRGGRKEKKEKGRRRSNRKRMKMRKIRS